MIITHLTSVHSRFDVRIYYKLCRSSKKLGDVNLICADGKGDKNIDGINIIDVGKFDNRFYRMWSAVNKVYQKAVLIETDIYHIHDPELLRIAIKLSKKRPVIFDMHEDYSAVISEKYYLNFFLRYIISRIYNLYESYVLKKIHAVITVTSFLKRKILSKNNKLRVKVIHNFPIVNNLINRVNVNDNQFKICYAGVIAEERGIKTLVKSSELTKNNVKINLAGSFYTNKFADDLRKEPGWKNVIYQNYLDRDELDKFYQDSIIGIHIPKNNKNEFTAMPIKIFEYLLAGLPIIVSDFPFYKSLIKRKPCGLVVNPEDALEVAKAIDYLIDNRILREKFSNNGKSLILSKYNWNNEEKKLFDFYKLIVAQSKI